MNVFDLFAKISLDTSEYDEGLENSEGKAQGFGSKLKQGLGTASKIAVGAVAAVGTAAVAAGTAMIKQTGQVAEYGDNIDKMSQKMGLSATAYQEWDAIMQHSGTSIEAMKGGMKTLANAVETGSDAFTKLGMSQEEIAGMSQEELFGATITALQNVEDETERTYLATKLLGRGGTELGALLNTSAEDTEKMRQRVHELGGVMSDDAVKAAAAYQDSLQDMKTAFAGVSRGIVSGFLPSVTKVMDGLTKIFAGESGGVEMMTKGISDVIKKIQEAAPRFIQAGKQIVTSLYQALLANLPQIAQGGTELIISAVNGLVSALPQLIPAAVQMVQTIATTIWEHLPELWNAGKQAVSQLVGGMEPTEIIAKAGTLLNNFVTAVLDFLPQLLEKGKDLVQKMAEGVTENAPQIIKSITTVLTNLITTIMQKLPQFLAKGAELIVEMAKGLAKSLPTILKALGDMLVQLIKTIVTNLPQFLAKGREIIANMLSGLVAARGTLISGLGSLLSTLISNIANKLKDFLTKGTEIVGKIASGILGAISTATSAIGSILTSVIAAIANKAGEFLSKGSELVSSIASGITGAVGNVTSAISDVISTIKNTISNIDWGGIGSNIIDGIKNGIAGAAGRLASAAVNAVKNAFNGMTRWLQERSPSKRAEKEIGMNWVLGIGRGFEKYMPVEDMVGSVKDAFDEIGSINAPTITQSVSGEGQTITGTGTAPIINIYPTERQNAEEIAAEVERVLVLWDKQRRSAFA